MLPTLIGSFIVFNVINSTKPGKHPMVAREDIEFEEYMEEREEKLAKERINKLTKERKERLTKNINNYKK